MYKVFTGSSVDEAINNGLSSLNVTEDDVKIDVIESGKSGFLGFGKKDAEVKLTVINPELKTFNTIEALIAGEHIAPPKAETNASKAEDKKPAKNVEPAVRVEEAVSKVEEETLEHSEAKEMHEVETEKSDEEPEATETTDATEEAQTPDREESDSSDDTDIKHAAELTEKYITDVVDKMDIPNTTSVSINRNEVTITFEAEKSAKIIGKRGATLNALQELAHTYFNGHYKQFGLVFLDVENYREKRKEILENLAINMSKKAIRTNQPVKLEPMPSFERKIMHNVLTDVHNIETYSEGQEPNRYLVIEKS